MLWAIGIIVIVLVIAVVGLVLYIKRPTDINDTIEDPTVPSATTSPVSSSDKPWLSGGAKDILKWCALGFVLLCAVIFLGSRALKIQQEPTYQKSQQEATAKKEAELRLQKEAEQRQKDLDEKAKQQAAQKTEQPPLVNPNPPKQAAPLPAPATKQIPVGARFKVVVKATSIILKDIPGMEEKSYYDVYLNNDAPFKKVQVEVSGIRSGELQKRNVELAPGDGKASGVIIGDQFRFSPSPSQQTPMTIVIIKMGTYQ